MNDTSGSADPYWYEWTVGVLYLLEMVRGDSEISSVALQDDCPPGWDDVVVRFESEPPLGIQVKHTREDDAISFSDLVRSSGSDGEGQSLIAKLFEAWRETGDENEQWTVKLFTNRPASEQKYTKTEDDEDVEDIVRPAFDEFVEWLEDEIRDAESLDDLDPEDEWETGWEEFLEQFDGEEGEIVGFLQALEIETDSPGSNDLVEQCREKLAKIFGIPFELTPQLLANLDSALREWPSTWRDSSQVTKEDVWEALSVRPPEAPVSYQVEKPEPFFPSRKETAEELEAIIRDPETEPIVFLSAVPGAGKTSLISYLEYQPSSAIDFRHYCYRPVTPQDQMLPADADQAVTAENLWSTLLYQLRETLQGQLAKYEVPIHLHHLNSEQLRNHTLRILNEYSEGFDRPVVVAIDGLDHAARAERPEINNLIETLVPPEELPDGVRFLLGGQPAEHYDYPPWLDSATNVEGVKKFQLGRLESRDIRALYRSKNIEIPNAVSESAINLIERHSNGNTLAVVFAVAEAELCSSVEQLESRLEGRRLSAGPDAYYEEIWDATLDSFPDRFYGAESRMAGALALLPERVNAKLLDSAFGEWGIPKPQWRALLRELKPLVVEENSGFRSRHNDVRLFLDRKVRSSPKNFQEIASKLADYYLDEPSADPAAKHKCLFSLLEFSERRHEMPAVFTPGWVLEGVAESRPLIDLKNESRRAVKAGVETRDLGRLLTALTGSRTVLQAEHFRDQNSSIQKGTGKRALSTLLPTEKEVARKADWDADTFINLIDDASTLVEHGEFVRAKRVLHSWLKGYDASSLVDELLGQRLGKWEENDFSTQADELVESLAKWGELVRVLGMESRCPSSFYSRPAQAVVSKAQELFEHGWARADAHCARWEWRLRYYDFGDSPSQLAEAVTSTLAANGRWADAGVVLDRIERREDEFRAAFLVRAGLWSILADERPLTETWADAAASHGGKLLDYMNSSLADWYKLSIVTGYQRPFGAVGRAVNDLVREKAGDSRHEKALRRLFTIGVLVGRYLRDESFVREHQFKESLETLLHGKEFRPSEQPVDFWSVAEKAVSDVIGVFRNGKFKEEEVREVIARYGKQHPVGPLAEVVWQFLSDAGQEETLSQWFDEWFQEDGRIWSIGASDRLEIVDRFLRATDYSDHDEEHAKLLKIKTWSRVGYSFDEDTSFGWPSKWLGDLTDVSPESFSSIGRRFFNASKAANTLGDNAYKREADSQLAEMALLDGPSSYYGLFSFDSPEDNQDWLKDTEYRTVSGIAQALPTEKIDLNFDQLFTFWAIAIGTTRWAERTGRGLIEDARDAILDSLAKEPKSCAEELLKKETPSEFAVTGREEPGGRERTFWSEAVTCSDENESEEFGDRPRLEDLDAEEAVRYLLEAKANDENNWKFGLKRLSEELHEKSPPASEELANKLLSGVQLSTCDFRWDRSYLQITLENLIPLLPEERANELFDELVSNGTGADWIPWAHRVLPNLALLVRIHACQRGRAALENGLGKILSMHETWQTGDGRLPKPTPVRNMEGEDSEVQVLPQNWQDAAVKILCKLLESPAAATVLSAVRGLSFLVRQEIAEPQDIYQNAEDVHSRKWVCLAMEQWATDRPDEVNQVLEEDIGEWDSVEFSERLQVWTVSRALERSGHLAASPPLLPQNIEPDCDGDDTEGLDEFAARFLAQAETDGSVRIANKYTIIHNRARSLAALFDTSVDDVREDIARAGGLTEDDVSEEPQDPSNPMVKSGDWMIHRSRFGQKVMSAIPEVAEDYVESSEDAARVAQAVAKSDDPWVITRSPRPTESPDVWPDDDTLRDVLRSRKKQLLKRICKTLVGETDKPPSWSSLGARLRLFSKDHDVVFKFTRCVEEQLNTRGESSMPGTNSGRSFQFYESGRFEPDWASASKPLAWFAEGFAELCFQTIELVPAVILQRELGWEPREENPLRWEHDSSIVAKYQRIAGPNRDMIHDKNYRYPRLGRWIVKMRFTRVGGHPMIRVTPTEEKCHREVRHIPRNFARSSSNCTRPGVLCPS